MSKENKKSLNEQLEKTTKYIRLAYIGQIMSEILHNVSNHLAVLHLNLEDVEDYLNEKGINDKYIAKKLKKQKSAVQKITNTVKELRTYVRRNQERTDIIDLYKILNNCINIFDPIFQKENIELSISLATQTPILRGENGKLQHVIMNILSSSRDFFTPEEGGAIKIHSVMDNNQALIEFTLSIVDIDNSAEKDITNECSKISMDKEMEITFGFVKDLGGELDIYQNSEKHKLYRLTLPVISEMVITEELQTQRQMRDNMSGRILVVDDEVDMLNIMKRYLSRLGFEVDIAVDGLEGLEYLRNNSYRFLISDLKMPRMSGEKMIQKARELDLIQDTKILIITGCFINQFADETGRPLREGVDGYIYKPFSKDAVYDILKKFED
jgi:CheY-like chemotaxis protein